MFFFDGMLKLRCFVFSLVLYNFIVSCCVGLRLNVFEVVDMSIFYLLEGFLSVEVRCFMRFVDVFNGVIVYIIEKVLYVNFY